MNKRSLLAVAVAALTSQAAFAAPFLPMDARGLAMGNTGVASAKRAHAPTYNPSLLSQASEDDDFELVFPQIGVTAADEEELVDSANDINDVIVPQFEKLFEDGAAGNFSEAVDALSAAANDLATEINNLGDARTNAQKAADLSTANGNFRDALSDVNSKLSDVNSVTNQLTDALSGISGDPLRGRVGLAGALAIPSKKFAAALSFGGDVTFSGRALFSDHDLDLLSSYGEAAGEYIDTAGTIPDQIDTVIASLEGGTPPNVAQVTAIADAVDGVSNFSSSTCADSTDPDCTEIFANGTLSDDAQNPNLDSQVQIVAVAVAELGLSFSREFEIKGEKFAVGITPKLQKISTLHFVTEMDNGEDIDTDKIEDAREDYTKFNLDIGASYRFGSEDNWVVGVVGKNLLGGEFDYADAEIQGNEGAYMKGGTIELNPQYRAGLSYNSTWFNAALDVDLTENEPVAFENPTQYVALGAEFDVFETLQLRAGYRTNLSVSDAEIVSLGFGLSPFGVHLDLALMANPNDVKKEAGAALEFGFYF
ncbi:conjugal transfer protein TraF [Thalassolituus sp. LLYu03]|uniref:conjugal transfer protein TraF n=1 Tax=Thalassolituus sp. LLYu03 TaxID=3421656 RepID=UPI003D26B8E5